MKLGS